MKGLKKTILLLWVVILNITSISAQIGFKPFQLNSVDNGADISSVRADDYNGDGLISSWPRNFRGTLHWLSIFTFIHRTYKVNLNIFKRFMP
jgi:hypothetical protein